MEQTSMTPIIFPHTRIEPQCLSDLLAVFERIQLKRHDSDDMPAHLAAARDAGRLEVSWSANDDGLDLPQLAAEYRRWLEDNRGAEIRARHLQRGRFPLVDETSVARLRTQILSGGDTTAGGGDDSRRMAQLFLVAADQWAAEATELENEMAGHAEKERALFEHLHGDPSELALFPPAPGLTRHVDPCAYMTPQWISAWCRIALDGPVIPSVWITASDAVILWMMEVFDGMRKIGAITRHALSDGGLDRRLDDIFQDAARLGDAADDQRVNIAGDTENGQPVVLSVYQVCGVSPTAAAERLLPGGAIPLSGGGDGGNRHLIVMQWHDK